MLELRGKLDENDIEYVRKRYGNPLAGTPCPIGKGGKINPHVSRFLIDGQTVSVFHIKPVYYETWTGEWRPLYEVASYYGNKKGIVFKPEALNLVHPRYIKWLMKRNEILKGKGIFIGIPHPAFKVGSLQFPLVELVTTTTVYPDPDPETTTFDGMAWRVQESGTSWSGFRDGAGTNASNDTDTLRVTMRIEASNYRELRRSFLLFDTSSITDTDTISAANLTVESQGKATNGSIGLAHNVYSSTPASNTGCVAGDFGNFGTTDFSTEVSQASWPASGADVSYDLNASGIADVSKTGVSKFGLCESNFDRPNVDPGLGGAGTDEVYFKFAETAGTASDPTLTVTHAAAPVFSGLSLLGVG